VKRNARIIWLFAFLFVPASLFAQSINWNPEKIDQTIGDGRTIIEDITVSFTTQMDLENVDLWITPELQRLVTVTPNHFDTLNGGSSYEVKLHFLLPSDIPEGFYRGTIHIKDGHRTYAKPLKATIKVDFGDIVIPSTTKVISESSAEYISSISEDYSEIIFSQSIPELENIFPGDIIVIGVSNQTPYGLLRKVDLISASGGATAMSAQSNIVINTSPATLEEAIQEGTILFDSESAQNLNYSIQGALGYSLTKVLYDQDGDPSTISDQVRIEGSLDIDPRFELEVRIGWYGIEYFSFINRTDENASLKIIADLTLLNWQEEQEILHQPLGTFVVMVGPVPISITPIIILKVGADGNVSVDIETGITQKSEIEAGVIYENEKWSLVKDFDNDFSYDPPSLEAECDLKGYVKPEFELLLCGFLGPYLGLEGYLEFEATLSSVLNYALYAGINVGIGVRFEIFSNAIADFYAVLLEFRKLLLEGHINLEPGENILPNPSFENGTGQYPAGWGGPLSTPGLIEWTAERSHTGSRSVKIIETSIEYQTWNSIGMEDYVTVSPNTGYELSIWTYWTGMPGTDESLELIIFTNGMQVMYFSISGWSNNITPGTWQQFTFDLYEYFQPGIDQAYLEILKYTVGGAYNNPVVYIDDVSLREK